MQPIKKSSKLNNVCYDIRGPVLDRARQMEDEGQRVIKLNIGNPASFGFEAPDEILQDVIRNLSAASGYCDSKGLFAARKAIMHYTQEKNIANVQMDDIYIGNGVSELIMLATQALLENGDEVLVPSPDYPLWTAAVSLAGGVARHYTCDEQSGWLPDPQDIRAKIARNTRAIAIINPNNPTGALYPDDLLREIIEIARQNNLIIFADEIYDKILYDGATHTSVASLADDVLFVTFNVAQLVSALAGLWSPATRRMHATILPASTCWLRCACVPMCRRNSASRLHWVAIKAYTTSPCLPGG